MGKTSSPPLTPTFSNAVDASVLAKNLRCRKIKLITKHLRQSRVIAIGLVLVLTCLFLVGLIEIYLRVFLPEIQVTVSKTTGAQKVVINRGLKAKSAGGSNDGSGPTSDQPIIISPIVPSSPVENNEIFTNTSIGTTPVVENKPVTDTIPDTTTTTTPVTDIIPDTTTAPVTDDINTNVLIKKVVNTTTSSSSSDTLNVLPDSPLTTSSPTTTKSPESVVTPAPLTDETEIKSVHDPATETPQPAVTTATEKPQPVDTTSATGSPAATTVESTGSPSAADLEKSETAEEKPCESDVPVTEEPKSDVDTSGTQPSTSEEPKPSAGVIDSKVSTADEPKSDVEVTCTKDSTSEEPKPSAGVIDPQASTIGELKPTATDVSGTRLFTNDVTEESSNPTGVTQPFENQEFQDLEIKNNDPAFVDDGPILDNFLTIKTDYSSKIPPELQKNLTATKIVLHALPFEFVEAANNSRTLRENYEHALDIIKKAGETGLFAAYKMENYRSTWLSNIEGYIGKPKPKISATRLNKFTQEWNATTKTIRSSTLHTAILKTYKSLGMNVANGPRTLPSNFRRTINLTKTRLNDDRYQGKQKFIPYIKIDTFDDWKSQVDYDNQVYNAIIDVSTLITDLRRNENLFDYQQLTLSKLPEHHLTLLVNFYNDINLNFDEIERATDVYNMKARLAVS